VVRDLSKEVWEISEDDPVDPHEVVVGPQDDLERCPRCGRVDTIIYQHFPIAGARSQLTTKGRCEKCGHVVGAPTKPPELRELPEALPPTDFGRRRRW
jgi:uncharacterized Zn finger protein